MEDVLRQILNKLDNLDKKVGDLDNKIDNLQQGQSRIEKKLDAVYNQTADLTEFRTSTSDNLTKICKDVSFIKHKLHQNEEEIFDIKSHIKIIK